MSQARVSFIDHINDDGTVDISLYYRQQKVGEELNVPAKHIVTSPNVSVIDDETGGHEIYIIGQDPVWDEFAKSRGEQHG